MAFGELDEWGGGRGSPARLDGVGRARAGAGPPIRGSRRARATRPGGLVRAELAFSISLEFLVAFLFPFL
jgi:hypothetical protein